MESVHIKIARPGRIRAGVRVFAAAGIALAVLSGPRRAQPFNQQRRPRDIADHVREDAIRPFLHDGDIILRLGDRLWSGFFKELSPRDKRFSHLGIIRIRDSAVSVINAEGLAVEGKDYVNEVPLGDFLSIALSVGVYRPRTVPGEAVSDTALEYKGRPFDWRFDMEEDEKLYCSELLYAVLKKLDPEIRLPTVRLNEIGKDIIPLDVCARPEYFTEVGYWRE
jgi:hypothetical protein